MRRSYWYVYEWYGWKLCFRGIISNKDLLSISTIVSAFGPTVEIQYLKLFQKFRFSKWRFVGQLKYPRFRHTARVFIQVE